MNLSNIYQRAFNNSPEKTAYICGDAAVTYSELDEKRQYYAQEFADLGIMPGDRVALCMHNIPQLPQIYLAVFHLGAIAVPISPYSTASELRYALVKSGSTLLIAGLDIYDIALEATAEVTPVERLICADKPDNALEIFTELPNERPSQIECANTLSTDPAMILFTSGSTANPKGIVHTNKSLFAASANRCMALNMGKNDIYFNSGYLCHGAASTMTLFPVLHSGGTAIFMEKFDPALFWPMVDKYRPTIAALGPSQLYAMLEHPMRSSSDISSLRYVTTGGDVVSEELHRLFYETMGFPLSESIGMTECGTYMTTVPGEPYKTGSMGKPITGVEVRLVNESGEEVKSGDVGQIIVRSDTVMSGYWQDEENTALAIVNEWLYTGDAAYKDKDGYYYFAGRIKNMLVRDSCNIPPLELESAIKQHPLIRDCGVVGIPDQRHGQKIIAFFELSDPQKKIYEPELRDFTATLIMQPRLPDRFFNIDRLPLTPLGKVDRKKLEIIARENMSETEDKTA